MSTIIMPSYGLPFWLLNNASMEMSVHESLPPLVMYTPRAWLSNKLSKTADIAACGTVELELALLPEATSLLLLRLLPPPLAMVDAFSWDMTLAEAAALALFRGHSGSRLQ
jgi:hypothetical protein